MKQVLLEVLLQRRNFSRESTRVPWFAPHDTLHENHALHPTTAASPHARQEQPLLNTDDRHHGLVAINGPGRDRDAISGATA